jgi:hypothetical protein
MESTLKKLAALISLVGEGFHPDTPIADYIKEDGSDLFTEAEAAEHQKTIDEVFAKYGSSGDTYFQGTEDVYDLCHHILNSVFPRSYPEK